jgi:hypothetical protein
VVPRTVALPPDLPGAENRHLRAFGPHQRQAVGALLRHIVETRPQLADEWGCSDDLMYAIDLWSAQVEPSAPAGPTRDIGPTGT